VGLGGHHEAHPRRLLAELLGGEVRAKAGDRLQLVDSAARVPQASAGHLRHGAACRDGQGAGNQGHLIPNAACRVLVGGVSEVGQVQGLSTSGHCRRERRRSPVVQPLQADRHQPGRRLRLRHAPRHVRLDEACDSPVIQRATALGRLNQSDHVEVGHVRFTSRGSMCPGPPEKGRATGRVWRQRRRRSRAYRRSLSLHWVTRPEVGHTRGCGRLTP